MDRCNDRGRNVLVAVGHQYQRRLARMAVRMEVIRPAVQTEAPTEQRGPRDSSLPHSLDRKTSIPDRLRGASRPDEAYTSFRETSCQVDEASLVRDAQQSWEGWKRVGWVSVSVSSGEDEDEDETAEEVGSGQHSAHRGRRRREMDGVSG